MNYAFFVPGTPVPKGSTRAFAHRTTGRIIVTSDSGPKLKTWQHDIKRMAEHAVGWEPPFPESGVAILLGFFFERPKKPAHPWPPIDTDKLVRAALDGLTGTIYTDDKQVVMIRAWKAYSTTPGLRIEVQPAEDPE